MVPRPRSLVPAALAVSLAGLVLGACGKRVGSTCDETYFPVCVDRKNVQVCRDGKLEASPCTGPDGCRDADGVVSCDTGGSRDGDPCVQADDYARLPVPRCSDDHRAVLLCRDRAFRSFPARGPKGCSGHFSDADFTTAVVGEPCYELSTSAHGEHACNAEGTALLECDIPPEDEPMRFRFGTWVEKQKCGRCKISVSVQGMTFRQETCTTVPIERVRARAAAVQNIEPGKVAVKRVARALPKALDGIEVWEASAPGVAPKVWLTFDDDAASQGWDDTLGTLVKQAHLYGERAALDVADWMTVVELATGTPVLRTADEARRVAPDLPDDIARTIAPTVTSGDPTRLEFCVVTEEFHETYIVRIGIEISSKGDARKVLHKGLYQR